MVTKLHSGTALKASPTGKWHPSSDWLPSSVKFEDMTSRTLLKIGPHVGRRRTNQSPGRSTSQKSAAAERGPAFSKDRRMQWLDDVKSGSIPTELGKPEQTELALYSLLQQTGSLDINPKVPRVSLRHFKADSKLGFGLGWAAFKAPKLYQVSSEGDLL